jgi:hypothetical protein
MERVKALGGVFFKTADSQRLREWYAAKLGLDTESWGTSFRWRDRQPIAQELHRPGFIQGGQAISRPARSTI